jgi:protease-4
MGRLRTEWLCVVVGTLLLLSTSVCVGSEPEAETLVTPSPSVVAHFHLHGVLTESPVADPFGLMAGQVTSLKDLVRRMDKASTDSRVKAVILTFDRMYFGFGQLEEMRRSIQQVKDAGKKVYVHAGGMTTLTYGLLCAGNWLSVAPQSSLWLTGFYAQSLHVKGLLDKIGVEADFMHMGPYKSAAEMLTRTSPSEPADENLNWLLDGWYDCLVGMIAQSRGKTPEQVRDLIDSGPYLAERALEKGLIDAVETREEFVARVREELEGPVRVDNRYAQDGGLQINFANPLAFFSILAELFKTSETSQRDAVAIIYVEGVILPGYSRPTLFGQGGAAYGGDIRKAIETAAKDASVKAVVMRVDSPGGSAEASEVILSATRQLQGTKPFIVSMGDVAGSGGYYVSCAADAIFADEATITASIGVVGGKLVTKGLWDKLGINWVGYKRGANADIFSGNRPFDDAQRQLLEDYMGQVYETFKGHVATGRGDRLHKPLEEIAGGRVYTGKQALDLGLVDHIGGLAQAIEHAAAEASLEDYAVRIVPEPTDFFTQLIEEFSGKGAKPSDITMPEATSVLAGGPTLAPLLELLRETEPQQARALCRALQRIELIRQEGVILMMPFDMILH